LWRKGKEREKKLERGASPDALEPEGKRKEGYIVALAQHLERKRGKEEGRTGSVLISGPRAPDPLKKKGGRKRCNR